jgi:2-polyprenyl-3-methyl-5-hydroxy-6-metoxy-1,4-benzoquinol methylase
MNYKTYQGDSLDLDETSIFFTDHVSRYWWASEQAKDKDVLDCGCGKGYGSYILSQNAKHVIGIDLNEGSLAKARENFSKKSNLEFLKQNVYELGNLNKKFDLITTFEVIEHLPPDKVDDFINCLKNSLKAGGKLLLSTPNHDVVLKSRVNIPSFHINNLRATELRQLLKRHFKNVEMLGQYKKRSEISEILFFFDIFNLRHSIKNFGKPPGKMIIESEEEHQGHSAKSVKDLSQYLEKIPHFFSFYRFRRWHWRQAGLSIAVCSND